MKTLKTILLLIMLSIAGSVSAQFDDLGISLSADEVIDNYRQATGLNKVDFNKAIYIESSSEVMGQAIKTIYIVDAEKFKLMMTLPGQIVIMVYNGTEAWAYNPMQNKKETIDKSKLKEISLQVNPKQLLNYFSAQEYSFEIEDSDFMDNGKQYYKIKASPKDKKSAAKPSTLYFNKTTWLLTFSTVNSSEGKVRVDFNNYTNFGDLKLPAENTMEVNGQLMKTKIDKVDLNYKIDETTFVLPQATVLK